MEYQPTLAVMTLQASLRRQMLQPPYFQLIRAPNGDRRHWDFAFALSSAALHWAFPGDLPF